LIPLDLEESLLTFQKRCPICDNVIEQSLRENNPQAEIMSGAYAVHLRTRHPRYYRRSWLYQTSRILIPILGVVTILITILAESVVFFIASAIIAGLLGFLLVKLNRRKILRFRVLWKANPAQDNREIPFGTPSPLNQCKICGEVFPTVRGRPEGLPEHYRTAHPGLHRWEKKTATILMSSILVFVSVVVVGPNLRLLALIVYSGFVIASATIVLTIQRRFRRQWQE